MINMFRYTCTPRNANYYAFALARAFMCSMEDRNGFGSCGVEEHFLEIIIVIIIMLLKLTYGLPLF